MAPEVAVVVGVTSHEGLRPLVLLEKVEEPTVKLVDPEKMARLGMQLHETDYLSKWGIIGATTLDASCFFMTLITSDLLLCSDTYVSTLLIAEPRLFSFISIASEYCSVQPR